MGQSASLQDLAGSGHAMSALDTKNDQLIHLQPILKEIEENRNLSFDERDYLHLYFSLENYILQTKSGYTKESLRQTIKKAFNTHWYTPDLFAVFNRENPDTLIFTILIFEQVLICLRNALGTTMLQTQFHDMMEGTMFDGIDITKDAIELTVTKRVIFTSEESMEKAQNDLQNILRNMHNHSQNKIGHSQTEEIFTDAFTFLERKYQNIPSFSQAVRTLPYGILEVQKFSLLSKEELEKVSKKLAKIDVMKSDFTNIAAHELKTPLIAMKGFLRMMQDKPKKYGLNKKGKEYVAICLRNSNRLERLVGDILDISKLEGGEMKFHMQNTDAIDLLKTAVENLAPHAKEKNVDIKLLLPKASLFIFADLQRLSQVITNLLTNAMKFTDKGTITVQAIVLDHTIQVSVTDTGMGIKKEDIKKLFTKFFQTQDVATRKTKGTGLGLAISKEIIEAHKGRIWAESRGLGEGTTFVFTLPLTKKS